MLRSCLFVATLMACAPLAWAEDASHCVQVSTGKTAQALKNTCREAIVVFWCHDSDIPRNRDGRCGRNNRYYQLSTMLEPGLPPNSNPYSYPLGAHISYGACVGGYGSYKHTDDKGGYVCKPPRKASPEDDATVVTTASASTAEEACRDAKGSEGADGGLSMCECEARGRAVICRVRSPGPGSPNPAMDTIRRNVRERLRCDPQHEVCKPRPYSGPPRSHIWSSTETLS